MSSTRLTFRAMGSDVSVVVEAAPEQAPLREIPQWFREWEQCLSRFDPSSELCALNRTSRAQVSETLWGVLQAAVAAAEATGGLISPALLQELEAAGYDRSFEFLAESTGVRPSAPRTPHDFRAIDFDESARRVALPPGLRLDLGGTGKGWAADQAAARLRAFGPSQVNAGGDIAVSGPRSDGRPWEIAVESPAVPGEILGVLELTGGGVATSGRDHRKWRHQGSWQHHLIDPRTGRPALTDVLSATVVGPSALVAEVAAKHVLLLGSGPGLVWLESQPALAALVVLEAGAVLESQRMAQHWAGYFTSPISRRTSGERAINTTPAMSA